MPASRQASSSRGSGQRLVVPADRRAEERPDLAPAAADHGAGGRKADPDVELPERPPEPGRDAELEPGDRAAGTDDPRQLAQRRRRVVDVAEQVGEREPVELAVGEGQAVGARLDELDAAVHAPAGLGEHVRALVDADDRASLLAHELARDGAGPGRDVEHAVARPGLDPGDEEAPPARILAVGEERGVAVVGRPERREQRLGLRGPVHLHESRSTGETMFPRGPFCLSRRGWIGQACVRFDLAEARAKPTPPSKAA